MLVLVLVLVSVSCSSSSSSRRCGVGSYHTVLFVEQRSGGSAAIRENQCGAMWRNGDRFAQS